MIKALFRSATSWLLPDPLPVKGKLYRLKRPFPLWMDNRARDVFPGTAGYLLKDSHVLILKVTEQYPELDLTHYWSIQVIAGEMVGWITIQNVPIRECLKKVG